MGGSGRIPYIQGFFKVLVMHTGAVLPPGQTDSGGENLGGVLDYAPRYTLLAPKCSPKCSQGENVLLDEPR